MSDLTSIIRFKKWTLDEERRGLTALLDERAEIEQHIQALNEEIASQHSVANTEVGSVTLGSYLEGARVKMAWLNEALRKKDADIEEKQDVVAEAFRELKTFEIADENKKAEAQKRLDSFEQKELDERGLQSYQNLKDVP